MADVTSASVDVRGSPFYLGNRKSEAASPDSDTNELVHEFLVESHENLDQLDRDLLALEQDPSDDEALARIFRCLHTIKGTCSFFGFAKLEALTHAAEGLLSRLRSGEALFTSETAAALLATLDAVRQILGHVEAHRHEGPGDYDLLTDALARLSEPGVELAPGSQEAEPPRFGDILVQTGRVKPEELAQALRAQQSGDERFLGEILVEAGALCPHEVTDALRLQEESRASALWDSTIRIEIRLIDRLIELVSELAQTHSQLLQIAASREDSALIVATTRLSRITTELQEGVMKTRMQPVGTIWNRLPRAVRDLAITCRKQIRLEMEGEEIRLGRGIIEAIKDPLLHLVRNAVDHGIELPEARVRSGKPPEGRLLLRAQSGASHAIIELTDDGAGIDPASIRRKALQRGLISEQQAREMEDRQLIGLIFLSGFSTAEEVTHISGRGVGMDVVKTNVERTGGTLEIESEVGVGTTIRMRVPLSLSEPTTAGSGP